MLAFWNWMRAAAMAWLAWVRSSLVLGMAGVHHGGFVAVVGLVVADVGCDAGGGIVEDDFDALAAGFAWFGGWVAFAPCGEVRLVGGVVEGVAGWACGGGWDVVGGGGCVGGGAGLGVVVVVGAVLVVVAVGGVGVAVEVAVAGGVVGSCLEALLGGRPPRAAGWLGGGGGGGCVAAAAA